MRVGCSSITTQHSNSTDSGEIIMISSKCGLTGCWGFREGPGPLHLQCPGSLSVSTSMPWILVWDSTLCVLQAEPFCEWVPHNKDNDGTYRIKTMFKSYVSLPFSLWLWAFDGGHHQRPSACSLASTERVVNSSHWLPPWLSVSY